MTKDQLVAKFKEMRKAGKAGRRQSAMGHLFGIIFDGEIVASSSNAAEIAREAGLREGDDGGIRDGQNLAEYVTVKPGIEKRGGCVTRSGEELPVTQDDLQMMDEEALAKEGTLGEREVAGGYYLETAVGLIAAAEGLLREFLNVPPPRAGPDQAGAAIEGVTGALEAACADVEMARAERIRQGGPCRFRGEITDDKQRRLR